MITAQQRDNLPTMSSAQLSKLIGTLTKGDPDYRAVYDAYQAADIKEANEFYAKHGKSQTEFEHEQERKRLGLT
jgi:hypothetical protein